MQTFLVILLVVLMAAAVVALIRGIIAFLKTTEAELNSTAPGPSLSGTRQNKMMFARIMFQALAVIVIVLLLLLKRG